MVTLSSDSRPIIGRGPPLGLRFVILGILSVVVMTFDHRDHYLVTARYWLGSGANLLDAAVQSPVDAWNWLANSFSDRRRLRAENERLSEDLRVARVKLLQFESMSEENRRLRAIRGASQGFPERTLIAEIIHVDVDPFRHRVRINKGASEGVFKGQPVLDAFGIVGQVTRVYRWSSEVILISDSEHAVPVQVNRNGIRTIAVGTGDIHRLGLPYLTIESDVKAGDLLVSSGLDGIFPAGYPVATILKVERNPAETFAVVEAKPLAALDRSREVLLLWSERAPIETNEAPVAPAPRPATAASAPASTPPASTPAAAPAAAKPATATPAPKPTTNPPAPIREELLPEQPVPQPPDPERGD